MRHRALQFVLLIGAVSFFADFVYEGARSVAGPYLEILGASATLVGSIAGLGELLGYGLRLVSGPLSERTRQFWPITIAGYVIQMSAVPLLAWAHSWQMAGVLIVSERVGRAIRNPPRDVMLSHAARHVGYGFGFGLHEALDQLGALVGPLVVALIIAREGNYRHAFAALIVPAIATLSLLVVARLLYPQPEDLEVKSETRSGRGMPRVFWVYLAGAALVAAGSADFALIAYHFEKTRVVDRNWIPIFYALAMAASGAGSLVFGRLFDRVGFWVLVPLTLISASAAPFAFWGAFGMALFGSALWGLGMGVHESIIPAAVATLVSPERRASAYGFFTGGYGIFWFIGSVVMGRLYDASVTALVWFSVIAQLAAIPVFLAVSKRLSQVAPGMPRD